MNNKPQLAYFHHTTDNVGDDIQALAAKQYLPPDAVTFDRDRATVPNSDSSYFLLANGWLMHPRNGGYQFPFPSQITPFFVSIHLCLRLRRHFTKEMVYYLQQHAPVGCRDQATLRFLKRVGIPSFFSGCLTMTLKRPSIAKLNCGDEAIYNVDLPIEESESSIAKRTHQIPRRQRRRPPHQRERRAAELLSEYASARGVRTSRLHCAIPCVAMGTPVTVEPGHKGRERFNALAAFFSEVANNRQWVIPSPTPEFNRHANALRNLVREAVCLRSNPMKSDRRFPEDFATHESLAVDQIPISVPHA
ncbi:MAG: polysaccharide pyruvyl transferase family protein [Planctomycetaceae bacterium]|nr:polysaccharide pyruvyl transferase family protein [Planctomycetaceae bacterium]MCB9953642.1 polysaccharide pyruvyl transferase family protein [Planctomycetaceae bacterium]